MHTYMTICNMFSTFIYHFLFSVFFFRVTHIWIAIQKDLQVLETAKHLIKFVKVPNRFYLISLKGQIIHTNSVTTTTRLCEYMYIKNKIKINKFVIVTQAWSIHFTDVCVTICVVYLVLKLSFSYRV